MTMAVQVETSAPNIIAVRASGKLSTADYDAFVPEVERLIKQHGKVRILFEMHDFHGWELGALWEDTKFEIKHFSHIERLAMVGDKKWEKGMAAFCKPFTSAKIRYFDVAEEDDAKNWIAGD
jgi:hypothetical protein